MPATISNYTISATLTQASIYTGIKSVFSALGYTPYAEYTNSGTLFVVYQKVFNAAKTFGNMFFRIGVSTTFTIVQSLGTAFDTSTNTLANAVSNTTSNALTTSSPVDIRAFKSQASEYDLVHIRQGSTAFTMLGWLRPNTLNNIDENSYTAAVNFTNIPSSVALYGTALNPYGNSAFVAYTPGTSLISANHYGLRDLFPNMPVMSQSGKGVFGLTSDDFAIGAGSGLGILESVGGRQCIVNRTTSDASIFLG